MSDRKIDKVFIQNIANFTATPFYRIDFPLKNEHNYLADEINKWTIRCERKTATKMI